MIDYLGMLKRFHKDFGLPIRTVPTIADPSIALSRIRLISEELSELVAAMSKNDLIEIADAIGDLLYVTFGTAVTYGLPMDSIFSDIHQSNMSKVGGYIDEGGKFIKPKTYKPVDLSWLTK